MISVFQPLQEDSNSNRVRSRDENIQLPSLHSTDAPANENTDHSDEVIK